ncbi:MAG: hypothetical protein H0W27_07400 [Actinobacteria bacterium]|nr:hypothetical protein [Actinomycetota bacterium]
MTPDVEELIARGVSSFAAAVAAGDFAKAEKFACLAIGLDHCLAAERAVAKDARKDPAARTKEGEQ